MIRWIRPPASFAFPSISYPVTRKMESAVQQVRTSANIWARLVRSFNSSMVAPFKVSFSVARMYGSLGPFQSKDVFKIASGKSVLG